MRGLGFIEAYGGCKCCEFSTVLIEIDYNRSQEFGVVKSQQF